MERKPDWRPGFPVQFYCNRWGRKKKPTGTFPAWGIPLSASRKPLCRCGLRSPAREIQTFSARLAIGTPASCRGSPFCFLPAPPRACVTTRTEKSGDQLPRGSAAWGEEGDKGVRSAPAGLAGLGRRAHTGIRRRKPQAGVYPNPIDRARRPKTGRPHRIVQFG